MKLLVLGGAGYIGSHTAYELLENGHEVVIADNLVTGYREAVPEKATFYQGDLRDKDFLVDLLTKEKVDAVILTQRACGFLRHAVEHGEVSAGQGHGKVRLFKDKR